MKIFFKSLLYIALLPVQSFALTQNQLNVRCTQFFQGTQQNLGYRFFDKNNNETILDLLGLERIKVGPSSCNSKIMSLFEQQSRPIYPKLKSVEKTFLEISNKYKFSMSHEDFSKTRSLQEKILKLQVLLLEKMNEHNFAQHLKKNPDYNYTKHYEELKNVSADWDKVYTDLLKLGASTLSIPGCTYTFEISTYEVPAGNCLCSQSSCKYEANASNGSDADVAPGTSP